MSDVDTTEKLQAARDAVERDAWVEAYELYAPVAESVDLGAEDLEQMATAAWWSGHFDLCVEARERADRLFTGAQDNRGAARVALDLAIDYRHQL
ncbi:MAG: LuxR family transcriptional regulator, partial [Chloroflexi bacterium]|nr:LuxR family transcriptional regulator [Chloroflexota bacterium]